MKTLSSSYATACVFKVAHQKQPSREGWGGKNCFPGDIQNTCEIFINDSAMSMLPRWLGWCD